MFLLGRHGAAYEGAKKRKNGASRRVLLCAGFLWRKKDEAFTGERGEKIWEGWKREDAPGQSLSKGLGRKKTGSKRESALRGSGTSGSGKGNCVSTGRN